MSIHNVRLCDRLPTAAEHAALAASVGWSDHFDDEVMAKSLERSLCGVVCLDGDEVVGMARLVGDGVQYAYVQDVIVRPSHSDQGIASIMVERLLERLREESTGEIFVGLFSSDEAIGVYESLGFSAEGALGMHLTLKR